MSRDRHVCERCHGVLTATKRVSIEAMIVIHDDSCPSAPPKVRRKAPVVDPSPPPGPARRTRTVYL